MAAFAVVLFGACHSSHDDHADAHHGEGENHEAHNHGADVIEMTDAQLRAAQVAVERISPADFSEVVCVSGRVLPASGSEATVTATMAGIVNFSGKALTEGMPVSSGQSLFTVNARPVADGNPAAAAQSELRAAEQDYKRAKKLAEEKIISQRELEDAQRRYETAAATARSLGNASQTRALTAPIGGYVKNVLVRPGDYVAAGQALATVTQNRRLQLRADVPERHYAMLSRISSANFRMAYDAQRVYSVAALGGRIVSKGTSAAGEEQFVPVIFEFNNEGTIVSGSFAEVYLKGSVRQGVISVPNSALTEAQGLYFVYVQVHKGEFRRVEVQLGATDGERTEIVGGLKAGDDVVTHGATQVRLAASAGAVPEGHSHG